MEDTRPSEELTFSPAQLQRVRNDRLCDFVSYLIFTGHGVRLGIEISISVFLFSLLCVVIPWPLLPVPQETIPLIAWLLSTAILVAFHDLLLAKPLAVLKKAHLLNCGGAFEEALRTVETISPDCSSFARLPLDAYYLFRAEVLFSAKRLQEAEGELQRARAAGAAPEEIYVRRSCFYRGEGRFDRVEEELETAHTELGVSPLLLFEQGMLSLERQNGALRAKKLFQEAIALPAKMHFWGDTTQRLARAFLSVARLKTGEAEEGLAALSREIDDFAVIAQCCDRLRPVVARLMLERGFYLATHREPRAALLDLKRALFFCCQPVMVARAEKIKEEVAWRYQLALSQ